MAYQTYDDKMNRRDFYLQYLEELLSPLKDCFLSQDKFGDVESCQGEHISWFEMFARSMYGVVGYTSVVGDNIYIQAFNKVIHKAIKDERYVIFYDYDQKNVELIPLALMLYIHKTLTWDTYTVQQQNSLITFFENVTTSAICHNNWQFFRIIVCETLTKLTGRQYKTFVKESWEKIDACYTGDGWYTDGLNGPKDYYIAWGYQFYSLLHLYLFPNLKERNQIIKSRVEAFAKDYWHMFDNDGRSIPYGRSLIYRYASLSFWSMYLLTNHNGVEASAILDLIDKNLIWWQSQDIRTKGFLNLGYGYRNESLCENYNSSGSVYWAFKFFLILLLDKDSPLWQLQRNKQCENQQGLFTIANGDIVIDRHKTWNIAYTNLHEGSSHSQNTAKYMRFAYNSACGFNLSKHVVEFSQLSDDSSLIFNIVGIKHQRESNLYYKNSEGMLEYRWLCGDLIKVTSFLIPLRQSYCRVHLIHSKIKCNCYETGFAIKDYNLVTEENNKQATIHNDKYVSSIFCLSSNGEPQIIKNECNSNIYYKHTVMPTIRYEVEKGFNAIIDYTTFSDNIDDVYNDFPSVKYKWNGLLIVDNNRIFSIPYGVFNALRLLNNSIARFIRKNIIKFYQSHKSLKYIYRKIRFK